MIYTKYVSIENTGIPLINTGYNAVEPYNGFLFKQTVDKQRHKASCGAKSCVPCCRAGLNMLSMMTYKTMWKIKG